MTKHILIGGNGFLGRELAKQLVERGEAVEIVDLQDSLARELKYYRGLINYYKADIAEYEQLCSVPLSTTDVVHHLASKLLIPNYPMFNRDLYYASCNIMGSNNTVKWMNSARASKMIFWSTDMVYGPALFTPRNEDHPRMPFGPYGRSKVVAEDIMIAARSTGISVTVLRPRLIIGPGRLGILEKLFRLIQKDLPVPLIGSGNNRFQFVSASDCARASVLSAQKGCPNEILNLGSDSPPIVYDLLSDFIANVGSKSKIIKTPASIVKGVLSILAAMKIGPMDPEQFKIADNDIILDITRARHILDWTPLDSDKDMLLAAYETYSSGIN